MSKSGPQPQPTRAERDDPPPEGWDDFRRAREEIKAGTAKVISLDEASRLIDDEHARQQWLDSQSS